MALRLCLLLAGGTAAFALGTSDAVDFSEGDAKKPIARVVELLEGMSAKLEEEQKADQELKEKFECWCKNNDADKKAAITAGKEKVARLTTAIEELGPRIEELGKQIRTATQEKNANLAALDTAKALRASQLEAFKKDEADLLGQISRVADAKERMEGKANSTGLLQGATSARQLREIASVLRDCIDTRGALIYSRLSRADRMEIDEFIANPASKSKGALFLQAPAGDFGAITGILRTMADDFAGDLQKEVDEEKANKKSYEELVEAKTKELKANVAEISSKTESKTKSAQTLVKAKGALKVTQKSLAEDIEFQAAVEKRCSGNDLQYEARMQDRAEEMEAISKTLAVLMGDDARSLLRKTVSFLQESSQDQSSRARAAGAMLVSAGQKLGAQEMVTLGLRSKIDSFTKVKKAIDDMVTALKAEQKDEVVQRDVCTNDLNKNDLAKQDKNQHKDALEGDIQELKTTIAKYGSDIKSLTAEIAEMQKQVQIAAQTREKENMEFQTDSDEQAQTQAVLTKAVKFLQNVYGQGASAVRTSFVQIAAHDSHKDPVDMALGAPEDFKEYKKNSGGSGAVSLIETIIQDSKKLQAEAVADEQEAQTTYEEFVKTTGASIKTKTAELEGAQKDKAEANGDLAEADSDREATIDELEKLHDTEMNLHKECDFFLANFEVRQKARAQEMEALAQAKGILGGADLAA
eukprot:TRINITY_DN104000_c0_g1_i1.p1 TRINITY_DN104000_c0_g1~~TRINITY_DN104000_c0_g1_i1.p1  ORF type:complete len:697 (+),score=218.08 TRINITY_DN104000_c0_g1_i1:66-2156(+)